MVLPNLSVSSSSGADAGAGSNRFDNSGWNVATGGGSNGVPTWALIAGALAVVFFVFKKRG